MHLSQKPLVLPHFFSRRGRNSSLVFLMLALILTITITIAITLMPMMVTLTLVTMMTMIRLSTATIKASTDVVVQFINIGRWI